MHLMDDLHWLAGRWVEEHAQTAKPLSLKTLGFRTVGDTKLFGRLGAGSAIMVPVFEKIVCFFAEPDNWPRLSIPGDVLERLALLGADVERMGARVYVERDIVERKLVIRA